MPVRALIDTRPADGLRGAGRAERTMGLNRPSRTAIALSPDGAWLVFSGVQGERQQLYRRRLSDDAAVPLAGTEGAESPFFSPDGRWVGFWSGGALWKVRLDGGVPTQLCPAPEIAGASWSSRDVIAFSSTKLYLVPASGGASTVLLAPDPARQESALRFPHFLPDGRTLLLTIVRDQIDLRTASIVAASLQGRARTALVEGAMDARYVPTGHLVYPRLGSLEAAPFDAARVATTGPQVGLLADLMQSANTSSTGFDMGAGQFSVSASGTLVFLAGGIVPDRRSSLVWVDRRGSTVATLPLPPGPYVQPRLSPDGRKILYKTAGVTGALWSYDRAARTATIIPTGRGSAFFPIWTPDGQRAVFGAPGGGFSRLWSVPVDGRAAAMRYEGNVPPTAGEFPGSWTPDGGTLIYTRIDEDGTHTIWQLRTDGGLPTRTELLPPPGWRAPRRPILYTLPALSPDGRWLAYASTESGTFQVYVERFPELGDRQQPWRESGQSYAPLWRRDGRELFFVEEGSSAELPRTMMAVDVRPDGRLAAEPRALFPLSPDLLTAFGTLAPYDVSPDGRQFIFVRRESPSFPPPPSQMHVVFNWFEELQAKVPRR